VNDLSNRLQSEIGSRISVTSEALLSVPPLSVDVTLSNFNNGLLNISDYQQVKTVAWDYFTTFSQLSFITVSTEEDNYYGYVVFCVLLMCPFHCIYIVIT
jgi:hypothetical protein